MATKSLSTQELEQIYKDLGEEDEVTISAKREPLTAGEVALSAVKSIPHSAKELVSGIISPVIHPIDTASNMFKLGSSVLGKMGVTDADPEMANAVGEYLADRYGGIENLKRTFATDPIGIAADASMLLTGGGTAAARIPGMMGRMGRVAATAGRAIDPMLTAGKVASKTAEAVSGTKVGKAVTEGVKSAAATAAALPAAYITGRSNELFKEAARAGLEANDAFLRHYRGISDMAEPVKVARDALRKMREARANAYQSGMIPIKKDPSVLDFKKIDDALINARGTYVHKGIDLAPPSAKNIFDQIENVVSEFRGKDPAKFHTPYDLDRMKVAIGNIRDSIPLANDLDRRVAGDVYRAVRDEIVKQAPDYGNVMKDYEKASDLLQELEKSFSLGEKASTDTALRKLQRVMRNNTAANFGYSQQLAKELEQYGGKDIRAMLAGQELSSAEQKGIMKLIPAGIIGGVGGGLAGGTAEGALLGIGVGALTSPKVVGGASYGAGRAARAASRLPSYYEKYPFAPLAAARAEDALRVVPQVEAEQQRQEFEELLPELASKYEVK